MKLLEFSLPYHDDDCRVFGAGVLPIAVYNGRVWALLGAEDSDGRWGVFGGSLKPEDTPLDAAVREAHEEWMGLVTDREELRATLADGRFSLKFTAAAGENRFFVSYLVKIAFDPTLPARFYARRQALLHGDFSEIPEAEDPRTGRARYDFIEKRAVEWFPLDQLTTVALRSRWNSPVTAMAGQPMFRRPFLAGLNNLVSYFNMGMFLHDLVWCEQHDAEQLGSPASRPVR